MGFYGLLAQLNQDLSFWERTAERWGIALVGFIGIWFLARYMVKREEVLQEERDKRDTENTAARNRLLEENNRLIKESNRLTNHYAEQQTVAAKEYASELKRLVESSEATTRENIYSLRVLAANIHCQSDPKTATLPPQIRLPSNSKQ